MSNQVKVSVILPTFNRSDSVGASIESVLGQTYSDLELIIIDDGSVDSTEEVVRGFKDDRIRYLKLEQNGGVSNARNIGVNESKSGIIAFEDSDDLWHADKLEKQMNYMNEHPETLLVYCAYEKTMLDGSVSRIPAKDTDTAMLEGDIYPFLLQRNTIGAPTVVMKKEAFNKVGGFDSSYPALEDWDLAIRVSQIGAIGYINEVLLDVTVREGGVSSSPYNYYEARCKMLADNQSNLRELGLFDNIAGDILSRASLDGVTDTVKKMMMKNLLEKML